MVSKGVKKSSAAEVKSSKADDSKRKIFDKSGKMLPITSLETADALKSGSSMKMKDAKSPKKVANNKTTKSKRPYKYNTPMKELVSLLEQYKKDNNPLVDELEAFIAKKRAQWKKFYKENTEKYKKWSANWRKNNPDKVAESQKRYQAKKKAEKLAPAKKTTTKSKKPSKKSK